MLTDIRVSPLSQEGRTDKVLAMASCVVSDFIRIDKIKIINGTNGPFVSMPRAKNKAGEWKDTCYPVNADIRKSVNDQVLVKYHEAVAAKASEIAAKQFLTETVSITYNQSILEIGMLFLLGTMALCKDITSRLSKGLPSPLPCKNNAWKDGYCKTHHPDLQKERNKKHWARWEQKWEKERIAKANSVATDEYKTARKEAGLLTLEEAKKLGAKIEE